MSVARNAMATRVLLDESYSHLLFIDSDMGFRPSLIEKMLSIAQPLVGSLAPARSHDYAQLLRSAASFSDAQQWRMAVQTYVGEASLWTRENGSLDVRGSFIRMRAAGTGVMLIERSVFTRMREAYPDLWSDQLTHTYRLLGLTDGVFQAFETVRQGSLFLSEDHAFTHRWTEMGGEIWSCFDETIEHVGREKFVGNFAQKLRAPRPPSVRNGADT